MVENSIPTMCEGPPIDDNIKMIFQSRGENIVVYDLKEECVCPHKTLSAKTLFFIISGKMEITGEGNRTWRMEKEEYVLLPKGMECQLKTSQGARYIEIDASKLASPEKKLLSGEIYNLKELFLQKAEKVRNCTILAGAHAILMTMLFSGKIVPIRYSLPGKGILFALEGKGELFYKNKEYRISEGEKIVFPRGGSFLVATQEKMKMLLLVSLDL